MGRPTKRTPDVERIIIDGLSDGIPLAQLCRENENLPHRTTVDDWIAADAEFSRRIARARELGFDAIAQRSRLTARGKKEDHGGESSGDVQRDKLIIETDLKLLAKWSNRYRDNVKISGDAENPLEMVIHEGQQAKHKLAKIIAATAGAGVDSEPI